MWLFVRTELECNRIVIMTGLAIAIVISLATATDSDISAEAIATQFLVIYVITFAIGGTLYQQEKRERLYSQLPLSRIQIALGDFTVWVLWTALFYGSGSLIAFATLQSTEPGFYADMLSFYLLVMGFYTFGLIAFELSNFRHQYWKIGYIAIFLIQLIVVANSEPRLTIIEDRLRLFVFGISMHFLAFTASLAAISISAMYLVYVRRDYYLK